ncbi:MAG: GrpB family protein [Phycisphaeraceae bacterium]|nr:GrpB family protein [Phycisphaeraceae bacterium]
METLNERIARVLKDEVAIEPYDPAWPARFAEEAAHLRACLPAGVIGRIEHFGSTAVPGLDAKPIIDMLIEVFDFDVAKATIVPVLEAQGYDYFWRPTFGDHGEPFYCWFIKRDHATGQRTHHLHMVLPTFAGHWDRLRFRDVLIAHSEVAAQYASLKRQLATEHAHDRAAYTEGKSRFVAAIMSGQATTQSFGM